MSDVTFQLEGSDFLNGYLHRPFVQVQRPVFIRKKLSGREERTLGIRIFVC